MRRGRWDGGGPIFTTLYHDLRTVDGNGPILTGILRGVIGGDKLFFSGDAGDVQVQTSQCRACYARVPDLPIVCQAISSHGITLNNNESAIYALTAGLDQECVEKRRPGSSHLPLVGS